MSLGGYMFEGRFCQKGSLTDVQWVLLMHKTKVAAFLAASARANAGWEYDMTGLGFIEMAKKLADERERQCSDGTT